MSSEEESNRGLEPLAVRLANARSPVVSMEVLRVLSEDSSSEVRVALAERKNLPGALESRLVRDKSTDVVRALVTNPHSSNYCIAQAPRWITWENNGRIYQQRKLPHHFWDMLFLYLFGTGAMALPLFTATFHVLFDGAVTPYLWPYALLIVVAFVLIYGRRIRNYPRPTGWNAWDC